MPMALTTTMKTATKTVIDNTRGEAKRVSGMPGREARDRVEGTIDRRQRLVIHGRDGFRGGESRVMKRLHDKIEPVLRLFGRRSRRVSVDRGWAHVEYRALEGEELNSLVEQVYEAARSLDQLRWVEVNPFLRRVTFSFPPGSYGAEQLAQVVEQAEVAARIDSLPFARTEREQPDQVLLGRDDATGA